MDQCLAAERPCTFAGTMNVRMAASFGTICFHTWKKKWKIINTMKILRWENSARHFLLRGISCFCARFSQSAHYFKPRLALPMPLLSTKIKYAHSNQCIIDTIRLIGKTLTWSQSHSRLYYLWDEQLELYCYIVHNCSTEHKFPYSLITIIECEQLVNITKWVRLVETDDDH